MDDEYSAITRTAVTKAQVSASGSQTVCELGISNANLHNWIKQYGAAEAKIRLSMNSTVNCYDNAAAESFFATVKLAAIAEGISASRRKARIALFDYSEVVYCHQRRHSGINYNRLVNRAA